MATPIFDEVRIPENLSRGTTGGPSFRTHIIAMKPGREQRYRVNKIARLRWTLRYDDQGQDKGEDLLAFFAARRGKRRGFRLRDHVDYSVVDQALGTSDDDTLQLVKTYTSGPRTYRRLIYKPVSGTVTLKKNDVSFTFFAVDYTSGTVFLSPGSYDPGDEFTWSGEFDVPVRFDRDVMQLVYQDVDIREWEIPIVELRRPPTIVAVEPPEFGGGEESEPLIMYRFEDDPGLLIDEGTLGLDLSIAHLCLE